MFKYRGVCSRDLRGSYIIKSIFCAAVLIFFVSNSNAQNEHPIKIGWIKEGLSPQEVKGAANYLAKQKEFNFIPISLKQLTSEFVKKNHLTHIWWLKDDQEIKANEKTAGPVLKQFVQSGGNLVLSMEAVRLLNEWGIEKNKFEIKEEVIFDKESSRLFWRILGIAPMKRIITSQGIDLGETPVFWVYYPDMRPIFAKYEVYNGKNYGARMSWEELFESRMFYGRIVKSTLDNPFDQMLSQQQGLKDNRILQLLEGENIQNKIFNYEQNLWSY